MCVFFHTFVCRKKMIKIGLWLTVRQKNGLAYLSTDELVNEHPVLSTCQLMNL